ncbi:MAG: histidine triad nucleotide-binding protein [Anaerolineales bacterium]|jgi:histidine triad (HIT) family protein|nr:histidine triad nucleotide-binding protein [Anaerolineales bacterium]MCW5838286.1 histidine triad nucleotide-binding protein [Anaerolineales bacterium]MCW5888565.1 histidine triad nucleotide-binding protein [Anaerolineales bacterium]
MAEDCIFCKIVAGEVPATQVYQDELVTAFRDIHPLAPTHILIIPNAHLASANELAPEHAAAAGRMLTLVPELARQEGIAESGYRLVLNTGADGRQEVPHVHLHLLGGRRMQHPLG